MKNHTLSSVAMFLGVSATIVLTGCQGASRPEGTLMSVGGGRVNMGGAVQLVDADDFEKVDLINLLDPMNFREELPKLPHNDQNRSSDFFVQLLPGVERNTELTRALTAFHDPRYKVNYGSVEARRNRIQDIVIAASDQRCNVYKIHLQRSQSSAGFWLGAASVLTGGLGAIFTNPDVTRSLSGASSILSGTRSEYNQQYYSNLTAALVSTGIDTKRQRLLTSMMARRNESAVDGDRYTVFLAISDALKYHGACSLGAGLEVASEAVQRVDDPGLRQMVRTTALLRQINDNMDPSKEVPAVSDPKSDLAATGPVTAAAVLKGDKDVADPLPAEAIADMDKEIRWTAFDLSTKLAVIPETTKKSDKDFEKLLLDITKAVQAVITADDAAWPRERQGYEACDNKLDLTGSIASLRRTVANAYNDVEKRPLQAELALAEAKAQKALGAPLQINGGRYLNALKAAIPKLQEVTKVGLTTTNKAAVMEVLATTSATLSGLKPVAQADYCKA